MAGTFEAHVSTATKQVSATGVGEWTVGGTYDPAKETIQIAIRSSGINARVTEVVLEEAAGSAAPAPTPFAMRWAWGLPVPRIEEPSTVLEVLKPSSPVVIPSEREVDVLMVNTLPQTGLKEFQTLEIDLRDPEPQMITQTFEDESGFGTRTTTWTFALIPLFNIERLDRGEDGRNSLVSTDSPTFQMGIPGVTMAKSGWTTLASWEVKGEGPLSGNGTPSQLPHSQRFTFQPVPPSRPTEGSTVRNRPLRYAVSAAFEGTVQYFLLMQDEKDLLRQEYIDHGEVVIPSREECLAHPIDGSFNVGNYNFIVDGGMQAALDKVTLEFAKENKEGVRVVVGFRCPQRNRTAGDVHPNNKHVLGRALDLAPISPKAGAVLSLYQACGRAGYHSLCEAAPGTQVPPGNPGAKYVHIDW